MTIIRRESYVAKLQKNQISESWCTLENPALSEREIAALDEQGVVKLEQTVRAGDALVSMLLENQLSPGKGIQPNHRRGADCRGLANLQP